MDQIMWLVSVLPKATAKHLSISLPFKKQCQIVDGQELHQPRSSSSDREDMQKIPDSDSLFACEAEKQKHVLLFF